MEARLFIGLKAQLIPSDRLDFFISEHLILKKYFSDEEWVGQELLFPLSLEECELKFKHIASLVSQINPNFSPKTLTFHPYIYE